MQIPYTLQIYISIYAKIDRISHVSDVIIRYTLSQRRTRRVSRSAFRLNLILVILSVAPLFWPICSRCVLQRDCDSIREMEEEKIEANAKFLRGGGGGGGIGRRGYLSWYGCDSLLAHSANTYTALFYRIRCKSNWRDETLILSQEVP